MDQWCDLVSVLLCDCFRCSNYGKAAKRSHKKATSYEVEDTSDIDEEKSDASPQLNRGMYSAKVGDVGSGGAPLPKSKSRNMVSLPPLPDTAAAEGIEMTTNPTQRRGRGAMI